jgi:fluoride exporter
MGHQRPRPRWRGPSTVRFAAGSGRPAAIASKDVLLVASGGAVGTLARVALAEWFPEVPGGWPWTTFVENVSGAFVFAVVLAVLTETTISSRQVRLAVCTGALGAFTTYSALAGQIAERLLAGDGRIGGVGYALASLVAGVIAASLGLGVAQTWIRRRSERR